MIYHNTNMGFFSLILLVATIGSALASPPTYQNHLLMPHSGFRTHKPSELNCLSWRVGVETHNTRDWTLIPETCVDYIGNYMVGKQYRQDCDYVSTEAYNYAKGLNLTGDGKDIWVFDVDETTLSNAPFLNSTGWQQGSPEEFREWFAKGVLPVLPGPLKLYKKLIKLGFKIVFLTGLTEDFTDSRIRNLKAEGYTKWEKLILKGVNDTRVNVIFKSLERKALEESGYRIRGNMGDQWSDLLGTNTGDRTFKMPNPCYYGA